MIEPFAGDDGATVLVVEGQVYIRIFFEQESGRSLGGTEEYLASVG